MTRRAIVALLVLVAAGSLVGAWRLPSGGPSPARADPPSAAPVVAAARTDPTPPVTATGATPVRLGVPGIDVGTRLVDLGVQDDGTVQVPSDPERAGWFDLGAVPGQVGSAVVLGHVDSVAGPAVFARLSELGHGDPVNVKLSDGQLERFRVRTVRTYPNADFPARKVYTSHGRPTLTLITCGGAYDRDRGGYQANVVVYAELA